MNSQSFGKYQLIKKIATGGMAEVWLAKQSGIEGFQRDLVLKRILPHLADEPEFVRMFLNEARIIARLNHPNIAQIYELGEVDGTYFIALEFVHGEDLGRIMRKAWSKGEWIDLPLAIRIVASCCEGLYYAHNKTDEAGRPLKLVHRDISPQNILVSFEGSVKLVDFGIAKVADQISFTKSGAIKGKFSYMSPEQAKGNPVDQRSDIFSIGLVFYELLTGVRPLKRENEMATLRAALECAIEPPSTVADVPKEMDSVVMKALAKSADDRYPDARQFQMALEEYLVSHRLVASSIQLASLLSSLFAERLTEEAKLGRVDPTLREDSDSVPGPEERPTLHARDKFHSILPHRVLGISAKPPLPPPPMPPALSFGGSRAPAKRLSGRETQVARLPSVETRTRFPSRSQSSASEVNGEKPKPPPVPLEVPPVTDGEPELKTAEQAGPSRSWVGWAAMTLVLAGISAGLGWKLFSNSEANLRTVYLTIDSNLPLAVSVRHQTAENAKPAIASLGNTPLVRMPGAHWHDTLILENFDEDVHLEEEVSPNQPHDVQKIVKEFERGYARFLLRPAAVSNIGIWVHGKQRGIYVPGFKLPLFEGKHIVQLRSAALREPVEIELDIKAGQVTDVSKDLIRSLDQTTLEALQRQ